MTKLGASKKIIITLLSIMLTVLAVFSVLAIISKTIKTEQPQASTDKIDYSAIPEITSYSQVNPNTTYKISSANSLVEFSRIVAEGNTFEGITIYLSRDIDLKNTTNETVSTYGWYPIGSRMWNTFNYDYDAVFEGTFDGRGHTISNMHIKRRLAYASAMEYIQGNNNEWGLFAMLGVESTVRNLRLYAVIFDMPDPPGETIWINYEGLWINMGALAGTAFPGAKILNCMVDGFTIIGIGDHDRYIGSAGGLIGSSGTGYDGQLEAYRKKYYNTSMGLNDVSVKLCEDYISEITDCHIKDFYFQDVGNNTAWGASDNCTIYNGAILTMEGRGIGKTEANPESKFGLKITNCLLQNVTASNNDYYYNSAGRDDFLDEVITYVTRGSGKVYKDIWDYENKWYFEKGLNTQNYADYAYLSVFVPVIYYFQSADESMGYVSTSEISVPFLDRDINFDVDSQYQTINGNGVSATPNTGYIFTKWQKEDDGLTYTAYFEEVPREKVIYYLDFSTISVTCNGSAYTFEPTVKSLQIDEGNNLLGAGIDYDTSSIVLIYHIYEDGRYKSSKYFIIYENIPEYFTMASLGSIYKKDGSVLFENVFDKKIENNWGETGTHFDFVCDIKLREYEITYNLDGGMLEEGVTNPTSYTAGDTFTLNNPIKEGWDFLGWTGTDLPEDEKTKTVTIPLGETKERSYTAHWGTGEYTITYNLNGGIDPGNPTQYTKFDSAITLQQPTREGYDFIGWSGTDINVYGEYEKTVIIPTGSSGDRVYTAHWVQSEVEIRFLPIYFGDDLEVTSETASIDWVLFLNLQISNFNNKITFYSTEAMVGKDLYDLSEENHPEYQDIMKKYIFKHIELRVNTKTICIGFNEDIRLNSLDIDSTKLKQYGIDVYIRYEKKVYQIEYE